MAIAPAITTTSASTVERIGRLMKMSVRMTRDPYDFPAGAAAAGALPAGVGVTGAPSPIFCTPDTIRLLAGRQALRTT